MTAAERVAAELTRRIGLDPDSLGTGVVPAAVTVRCRELGIADPDTYADRVRADRAEFQTLIERLVVPETWFYRGRSLFEAIGGRVAGLACRRGAPPVRILSMPCSTGEEAYSLAIACRDRGVPVDRFRVDAIDISRDAIAAAERGVYREFAFRELPAGLRDRWFDRVDQTSVVRVDLRDSVRFVTGNVLEPSCLGVLGGPFDVILCRNLLIYLTADARRAVLNVIDRLLGPTGILAVGSAEAAIVGPFGYDATGPAGDSLFTRRTAEKSAVPAPKMFRSRSPTTVAVPSAATVRVPDPAHGPTLASAKRLADAGRLDDALAECRTVLTDSPSADGYALLGVLCQTAGEADAAADALRRALYLDPNHRVGLTHALALALAAGRYGLADTYKARLDRLPPEDRP